MSEQSMETCRWRPFDTSEKGMQVSPSGGAMVWVCRCPGGGGQNTPDGVGYWIREDASFCRACPGYESGHRNVRVPLSG